MNNRPVNTIKLTEEQLNRAVETYLNEHVFRDPIKVGKVETSYSDVTVELIEPEPKPAE